MKEKLRIGILLNDFVIPSWEFQIIDRIKKSEFSEIVLVIKNTSVYSPAPGKTKKIAGGLLKLIEKADRLVFKTVADYSAPKDISETLKNIRRIEVGTGYDNNNTSFNSSVISEIKDNCPDIILKFGHHDLRGDILKIPKYGIWSHSIDNLKVPGSPDPGFWEVVRKRPVTSTMLEILKADNEETEVIFSSVESTCHYSVNINRDSLSWRSALFAPRVMRGLYEHGDDYLNELRNRFRSVIPVNHKSLPQLSAAEAAIILFTYCGIVAKSILKKLLFTDAFRWQLWYDLNGENQLSTDNFGTFKRLSSPDGIFWADPFVVAGKDFYYLFVEEFIYKKDRAHISVLKLDRSGNFLSSEKIIEKPYHMSYPFVFKLDKTYYMIPETAKNKTIELYKCIDFPYKWEFDRNIMENLSATDTTLLYYNNKWWLFASVDQTDNISGCSTELFLFFADDIFSGRWRSHRLNPIVSDVRRARPAGKMFILDGKIFRPSQNCSGRYGIGFNINRVLKLTEDEYEETMETEVKPIWDRTLRGTHTLNSEEDFTVIDVYSFRRRFSI